MCLCDVFVPACVCAGSITVHWLSGFWTVREYRLDIDSSLVMKAGSQGAGRASKKLGCGAPPESLIV